MRPEPQNRKSLDALSMAQFLETGLLQNLLQKGGGMFRCGVIRLRAEPRILATDVFRFLFLLGVSAIIWVILLTW